MLSANPDPNSGLPSPLMMSGAVLPNVHPPAEHKPGGPQIVAPPELPKRRSRSWIWLLLVAVAAGAGYWYWTQQQNAQSATKVVSVRSGAARSGKLEKTLRLTGSTGAEKYVSLIAPSMRGGRGGMVTVSMGGGRGGGMVISVSGSSGSDRNSSTSSTVAATSSLASTSMSNSLQSTSGAASGTGGTTSGFSAGGDTLSSSAGASGSTLRTGGSRSGGGARAGGGSRGASRNASAGNSATLGADGLGSTSGQIPGGGGFGGGGGMSGSGGGGGGRGGGMSDFMMQLQTLAPNGVRVAKGDTVAEFDRQYMLLRLDDYKANVDQSENSMKASVANLEVTRKSYEQQIRAAKAIVEKAELDMKTIPVRGAIDTERLQLSLEEAKANLKQLQEAARYVEIGERATLKVAELALETSKVEFRRAQSNAERMVLKAPMDGLVVVQNTFRGGEFSPIQQGDQVYPGMMFMQIVEPNSMVINANVNQVDVQRLRLGQKAAVRFDAFPGLELPARLVMIGAITKSAGMRASFKKDVAVRLKLEKIDPRVIPDLSVSADIVLDEEPEGTIVPSEAILSESDGPASSKTFVMVKNAANVWERREVEVGLISYTHASIRRGLKPGEVVALEPVASGKTAQPLPET